MGGSMTTHQTFEDLTGKTINTLRVTGRAFRANSKAVLWEVVCEKCNTKQTANHRDLQLGKAHCARSGCGLAELSTPTRAAAFPVASVRTRDTVEAHKNEPSIREVVRAWAENNPNFIPNEQNMAAMNAYFAEHGMRLNVYENHDQAFQDLRAAHKLQL
jgi:hypothetical protein